MNNIQKLAVAQAMFNACSKIVSTKNGNSLRSTVDEETIYEYKHYGVKNRDVLINGYKVGTYSIKFSKEKPAVPDTEDASACVEDVDKFNTWLNTLASDNLPMLLDFIFAYADDFAAFWLEITGELPDGCEVVYRTIPGAPAEPSKIIGTTLKIDEYKVADALKGELPEIVSHLLESGD